jgi:hypothetical protein
LANFIAQITPVFLESMRLIAIHEPEKPLAALGNFFLGVPIVACAVHTPYRRDGPEAAMVMEAVRLLACSNVRPEEPAKWMGDWPLVFSILFDIIIDNHFELIYGETTTVCPWF